MDYFVVVVCNLIEKNSSVSFTAIFSGTTYRVVMEGFDMSDVGNVLVLSDEVTDSVNIFYISSLDVRYFIGYRNCTCWGPFSQFRR